MKPESSLLFSFAPIAVAVLANSSVVASSAPPLDDPSCTECTAFALPGAPAPGTPGTDPTINVTVAFLSENGDCVYEVDSCDAIEACDFSMVIVATQGGGLAPVPYRWKVTRAGGHPVMGNGSTVAQAPALPASLEASFDCGGGGTGNDLEVNIDGLDYGLFGLLCIQCSEIGGE